MKQGCKVLIDVSDIHCGSEVGLAPPVTTTRKGNIISFGGNLVQEWLWQHWTRGIKEALDYIGGDPFALLINGDATEGAHHHNNDELIAADIETHTNMAFDCLKPLAARSKKTFVVAGTECHTRGMETILARKLKAERGEALDKWHFTINDCEIDAAHHTSVTSRAYLEASAMSIMMGNARVNYTRSGHTVPKVFLRGHRHCGGYYSDGDGLFAVTGAWQFLTRHGHKVVTDSIPRPSILILDWRSKPPGSLPIVNQITFNPPSHASQNI